MDLNQLSGIVDLNETNMTVTLKAATTWSDLEEYLNARGFACKSMPSSAPAATVGGWLCMMGYGLGSLKYGDLLSQVRTVEVVLPDGKAATISPVSDPPLKSFVASEGTLGIITEVKLEIRRLSAMKHFIFRVPDMHQAVLLMNDLAGGKISPYNMHFSDHHHVRMMNDLGFSHADSGSSCLVAVDFEGPDAELAEAEAQIGCLLETHKSATLLPEAIAELEWTERFRALRLKRGGPSMLGGEILLPVHSLVAYLEDINKTAARQGVVFMSYGHVVTSERATVMTAFFADESKTLQYILSLALVKKIQDAGYRYGGCPYGVGLWNTPYIRRIYSSSELKALRKRKSELDPKGIMNPGKVYRAPFLLNPLFFHVGMAVLALMRGVFRNGR
jgi:glycolate oxidase